MEASAILFQFIGKLWFLIPLILLMIVLKSPWFKGILGESIINFNATRFLDKEQYHLIKNVTLPTKEGSTQIDHIIVSKYGVFVVETKNMKGWIFGSPNQKTWTQKIYKHTSKFQNPIHQNYKHIKTLESLLGLNDQQIHSVIVFIGDCTFKTDMPEYVTYGGGYLRYIESKTKQVLTDLEVDEITSKIESGRLMTSFKTNRAHVAHIKEIIKEKENSNSKECPKCGSSMVIRKTKKGQNIGKKFWGCSSFPKCRYTAEIT